MMIYVYGITNCDKVKKSRKLLDAENIEYTFVDFKKTPLTQEQVVLWLKVLSPNSLINKQGTTWRTLTLKEHEMANHNKKVIDLIIKYPLIIRRPLIEWEKPCIGINDSISTGFDENEIALRIFEHISPTKGKLNTTGTTYCDNNNVSHFVWYSN